MKLRRDYDSAISEFRLGENRSGERALLAEEEVRRLKGEVNTYVEQYNRERLRSESLANELLLKEGQFNKLQAELRDLQKSSDLKEAISRENIDTLNLNFDEDKALWEEKKIELQGRIQLLEKQLKTSQAELNKTRQDIQKLSDLMINNLTKSVHNTFSEFRLMA